MNNPRMKKRLAIPLGLVFLATVAAGLAFGRDKREKYEEKFEKTEALARDGTVVLTNFSGNTEVRGWKEGRVKIEALKVSEADTMDQAKENAGRVSIEVSGGNDQVRIDTKYPEQRHSWGRNSFNVSVSYKIWIPDRAAIDVKSFSGNVNLTSIGGAAKVNSMSGDVEIIGAAGVEVKLTSGELTLEDVAGDAYLKTISGNVLVKRVKGSIELESVSGGIELLEISEARSVSAKVVSGDVTYAGKILPGGNYEFKSHSGNVEIQIPANSAFDLEANSFSGTIDSEFDIQVVGKISPKEVRGTVNKGGARIRLTCFSGNVEIKKR